MTVRAFFHDISVLEEEGPGFFGMAFSASFFFGNFIELFGVFVAVGLVAIGAVHFALPDGVSARQRVLCADIQVAADTAVGQCAR